MSISLSSVSKSFSSVPAVDDVSAGIAEGEFFCVLGPSGCGKSTLLRLIAGLETLDSGEISVDGKRVAASGDHVPPERRGVGVVFQSYALWPHMSVRQNVAFPVETAPMARAEREAWTSDCLDTVALGDYAERKPAELSGGQRQRVALARCLAQRARVILMDEPLANLDPHLRAALEEELSEFHRSTGSTTLYITHDQREAMALADRIAIMWQGRILQIDSPEALYRRPAREEVARFIGRGAVVTGAVERTDGVRARFAVGGHALDVDCAPGTGAGEESRLLIRPEDVSVADDGLDARISKALYRGGHWEANAEVDGFEVPIVMNLPARPAEGDTVRLRVAGGWVLPRFA